VNVGDVARQYYKTICQAVKTVDPNHLIFGDRFNGNKGIPNSVLDAMKDHVDMLSVQYFCEPSNGARMRMLEDLKSWSDWCGGKLVLVADIGNWCATEMNLQRKSAQKSQKREVRITTSAASRYSSSRDVLAGTGVAISRIEAVEAGVGVMEEIGNF
jgi:hypothetical protein